MSLDYCFRFYVFVSIDIEIGIVTCWLSLFILSFVLAFLFVLITIIVTRQQTSSRKSINT
eukprot:m.135437 g.135437  ORF g.135437 m.135437 type:complete len:60 (-) comp10002_c0_seq1:56-235(-)